MSRFSEVQNQVIYIDALEKLDVPLEQKLQISMLFGDFDHAIKVLTPILKQVYLSVEKLNQKYEREILSRFGQIQSDTNIRAYENFLKYDKSRFDSTEISICLLNQYVICHADRADKFFMMLGYRHEESIERQSESTDAISVEQFILCCGNELRLRMIKAFCEHEELTSSQLAQILDCPVTTTIRHTNMLCENNLNLHLKARRSSDLLQTQSKIVQSNEGTDKQFIQHHYSKEGLIVMKNIHLDKQAKKWNKPQVKTVSSQELKRVISVSACSKFHPVCFPGFAR